MKPVVVIHVDALRREYVSSWFLGQKFKKAGYRVILTSRISTPYLFRVFTPDIVILSHVFVLSSAALTALLKRDVKVYINEVEGVIEDEAGIASTYPDKYIDYRLFAGIFVWSKWSRDWLIQHRNVDTSRVHATGSIRNSVLVKRKDVRDVPIVGILSRFELINTFDSRHNFENLLEMDPEEEALRWYYDRWVIDAEAFSIVSKMIGILTAKGVAVSMRPHPNENLSSYRLLERKFGPLFRVDQSYDINEWLSKVSVVVGPTSTAYTEAYLVGIPVVSTQGIQKCHYSGAERSKIINEFARASHMPSTVEAAVALCMMPSLAPINSDGLKNYFNRFYTTDLTDPADKIMRIVVDNHPPTSFPKKRALRSFGSVLKYLIDVASLCRAALTRHPIKALNNMKQYNFCAVLHRPSCYMKKLESRQET
jgi:surface carbohydrate biosynthesis protein